LPTQNATVGILDRQTLLDPIAADQPCGLNPDDTVLPALDSLRLFGQARPLESPTTPDQKDKEQSKPRPPVEWERVRAQALEGLSRSKDLRLLAYLGTAVLRTDGLPAFAHVLTTAAQWLETYWADVYPPLEEDAVARINALNCFADPMAVLDRLWRLPLVESRQHGRFSLRDIEIARGQAPAGPSDTKSDEAAIVEAFNELSRERLRELQQSAVDAVVALNSIDARMRSEGGPEAAPTFAGLLAQFARLNQFLLDQLASRSGDGETAVSGADSPGVAAASLSGTIASRQEAIRALDAVADYFRRHEPSSPIPLFVERAKRLVAKDFLEVLADIAPDAVAVARSAGGLKDQ